MAKWRHVGEAVTDRRKLMGLSIAECARRASLSGPTWGKLERGEVRQWKPATLEAVARVLLWPDNFVDYVTAHREVPTVDWANAADRHPVRQLVHWMADNLDAAVLAALVSAWATHQAIDDSDRAAVVRVLTEPPTGEV